MCFCGRRFCPPKGERCILPSDEAGCGLPLAGLPESYIKSSSSRPPLRYGNPKRHYPDRRRGIPWEINAAEGIGIRCLQPYKRWRPRICHHRWHSGKTPRRRRTQHQKYRHISVYQQSSQWKRYSFFLNGRCQRQHLPGGQCNWKYGGRNFSLPHWWRHQRYQLYDPWWTDAESGPQGSWAYHTVYRAGPGPVWRPRYFFHHRGGKLRGLFPGCRPHFTDGPLYAKGNYRLCKRGVQSLSAGNTSEWKAGQPFFSPCRKTQPYIPKKRPE